MTTIQRAGHGHRWRRGALLAALALWGMRPTATAQTVATMGDLTPQQKAAATDLTLTGRLTTTGNSDFRQLRDLCYALQRVDLATADCRQIPANALHSRHRLQEVVLPQQVRVVGTQAFFACDALTRLTLPATVDSVAAAAFAGCTALTTLVIEGAPRLESYAFGRCSALRRVTVNATTPPPCADDAFEGIDRRRCRLVVPRGSEARYRQAAGWRHFFRHAADDGSNSLCRPAECLLPLPAQMVVDTTAARLDIRRPWHIVAQEGLDNEVEQARRLIADLTQQRVDSRPTAHGVRLEMGLDESLLDEEAYTLSVSTDGIYLKGRNAAGVFRGLMTLQQLIGGDATTRACRYLPQLAIHDRPRTRMRELMVDPARIFLPFDDLRALLPEMARYKYNALHLHLVDDQAWRIEIKHYPQLVEKAATRTGMDDMLLPISGYYTQEQMKQLVAEAARYHIDIIPEIEMPGHEVAAIHCFPQLTCGAREVPLRTTCGVSNELLCPGEDFVYEFLGNVFGELAEIFPSRYIHLGGDEAGNPALGCWTDCDKCRALKRRLGIDGDDRSDNWRLQQYLFDRIIDTLRTRYDKTPMFWYETDFKTIQPGCITFAWRHGLTAAAIDAARSNDARIMLCPGEHCYLDYPMAPGDMPEVNWGMPVTSLQQTYRLDPAWGRGEDFEQRHLFGVAGTLWSECITSTERLYYQAFPRALALAEAGWSPQEVRRWDDFLRRLTPRLRDMQRRGIDFSPRF